MYYWQSSTTGFKELLLDIRLRPSRLSAALPHVSWPPIVTAGMAHPAFHGPLDHEQQRACSNMDHRLAVNVGAERVALVDEPRPGPHPDALSPADTTAKIPQHTHASLLRLSLRIMGSGVNMSSLRV